MNQKLAVDTSLDQLGYKEITPRGLAKLFSINKI